MPNLSWGIKECMESCACLKEMVELVCMELLHTLKLIFDPKLWFLGERMHGCSSGKLSLNWLKS